MTTEYPLRWGILGAANIAVRKVVPAMRASPLSQVVAIASRSIEARAAATARDADQVPVSLETNVGKWTSSTRSFGRRSLGNGKVYAGQRVRRLTPAGAS